MPFFLFGTTFYILKLLFKFINAISNGLLTDEDLSFI